MDDGRSIMLAPRGNFPAQLGTGFQPLPGENFIGGGYLGIDNVTRNPVYDPIGTIDRGGFERATSGNTGGSGFSGVGGWLSNPSGVFGSQSVGNIPNSIAGATSSGFGSFMPGGMPRGWLV